MIPDKLEQESKKLKDSIIESINQFKYETNLIPMVEIKIIEIAVSCSVVTKVEVVVKIQL